MPSLSMLVVAVLATQQPAPANTPAAPQSKLICYGFASQIGVVARREFRDESGFLFKAIYYTSTEPPTKATTCAEETLRVHSVTTYTPDSAGRPVVETDRRPDGAVEAVSRLEYRGNETSPSRTILSGRDGKRQCEVRAEGGRTTHIYFDDQSRVIGVIGKVPADLDVAIEWGPEADGWSCGITAVRSSQPPPYEYVYLHLRNSTAKEGEARFTRYFESELRDSQGALVPLTEKYLATAATGRGGSGMLVRPGETAFDQFDLDFRYGRLRPGRYSLVVRHPHPVTGAALVSNTITFDVK